MMDKHHLQVGSGWGLRAGAGSPALAEGQETVPPPSPPSQTQGMVRPFLMEKWAGGSAHWLPPPALFRGLQGPKACISRGDSKGYEEGNVAAFFFSGELRISVTRGPHGRAMPPAPSHYPPARPAALTRQSHQKQLARVCSERPEVCKTDSAVLHFSSLARVFIAAEGTAWAGAPSWPSPDNSSARQNAWWSRSKLPAFQGFIWRRKRALEFGSAQHQLFLRASNDGTSLLGRGK